MYWYSIRSIYFLKTILCKQVNVSGKRFSSWQCQPSKRQWSTEQSSLLKLNIYATADDILEVSGQRIMFTSNFLIFELIFVLAWIWKYFSFVFLKCISLFVLVPKMWACFKCLNCFEFVSYYISIFVFYSLW